MSLVGSLEDLGLADILQIVSLSRKSGMLVLRSESGDGCIGAARRAVQARPHQGQPGNCADARRGAGVDARQAFDLSVARLQ